MDTPLIRVMALHALAYCERLFYLEEVEEIRVADDHVYAGRTLHETEVDKNREWQSIELASEEWGIRGKVDFARYRDGQLVAIEHKKGRSKGDEGWDTDKLQVTAYAVLLAENFGKPVTEGRIRYHKNNKTIRVPIGDEAKEKLRQAITRARELSKSIERPPVTDNENLCARCSLAPVCLPEEERFHEDSNEEATRKPKRLFPKHEERRTLHVTEIGSRVVRSGLQFVVRPIDGKEKKFPGKDVGAIVLHGNTQISAQAIHFAAAENVAIHWLSGGGRYIGGINPPPGVQRRLRQYQALADKSLRLELARQLALAKIENQLRFLARSARTKNKKDDIKTQMNMLRSQIRSVGQCEDTDSLRGCEGVAARSYFDALACLLGAGNADFMSFTGRTRRPPQDAFNAALSFGYALLYRDVMAAIILVGLDSTLGFFHTPRSAAHPLALDLMEIFRVLLWDMSLVASVNRRQWKKEHFNIAKKQVWLSDEGRRQAIGLYETRKQETWKHPVLDYSLSYARTIELEVRLLEKEWSEQGGNFAKLRLR